MPCQKENCCVKKEAFDKLKTSSEHARGDSGLVVEVGKPAVHTAMKQCIMFEPISTTSNNLNHTSMKYTNATDASTPT